MMYASHRFWPLPAMPFIVLLQISYMVRALLRSELYILLYPSRFKLSLDLLSVSPRLHSCLSSAKCNPPFPVEIQAVVEGS
ncbi:uncharacterized protein GGS25DRAFT_491142 [Hypoxylon fragiforme]|uniref:uncharacterized protein n=1 Tax=Hypoxylon fragiforme TaxID=63214 RepID=UPI0020C68DF1|nr:uncharacterized protein GGS25DRAFT_491142 [Hypoxylon fragiforme]KAI2608655.1 hypothetical protein GGS25DRAFT_491142 [Hypoxylon fragiforme]